MQATEREAKAIEKRAADQLAAAKELELKRKEAVEIADAAKALAEKPNATQDEKDKSVAAAENLKTLSVAPLPVDVPPAVPADPELPDEDVDLTALTAGRK